jgi:hypothetical protein
MSYPINYPTPQGANIQIFNAKSKNGSPLTPNCSWIKPQGASFVWFTLIGGGGGGDNIPTYGGGSGAVTNCMVPAFLIPDELVISVPSSRPATQNGDQASVKYQLKNGTPYTLLTAEGGFAGSTGGTAMASNYFSAMGIFQSVAGQDGTAGLVSASPTTFLSGGGVSGGANPERANYGYTTSNTTASPGFFILQPIIVGIGGVDDKKGGTGCGGGSSGAGGDGLVVIITW